MAQQEQPNRQQQQQKPQQQQPQFADQDLRATDHYLKLLAARSVRAGPQAALEDRSHGPPSGN